MNTTDYEKQAQDFLDKHGIAFRATLSDSKPAPWRDDDDDERQRHHYRVTLSRGRKGKYQLPRPRLTFDFWGSIADAEKGIVTVTPYDVLACISGDVHCPETFEEWCQEYGYDQDSLKALQTFRRCSAFAKRLRAFFTEDEIEALSEIN